MIRKLLATAVLVALGGAVTADELKSGPAAGQKVPGPFHPLNVNGEDAGKKACLYCKNGDSPVVAVFARNADDPNLQKLVKALDAVTVANAKAEMGSFVVYLSTDDKLEAKLKDQAKAAGLKETILAIEAPEALSKYNIAKDADVTVLLYKDRTVVSNFAFEKGKFSAKDVEAILADVAKITK